MFRYFSYEPVSANPCVHTVSLVSNNFIAKYCSVVMCFGMLGVGVRTPEWNQVQGHQIVVADSASEDKSDLMEDFVSIIYSFATRLYGLRFARRRTDQVLAALKTDPALEISS